MVALRLASSTDLNAEMLKQQIETADTIVINRTQGGGVSIAVNNKPLEGVVFNNGFASAIESLVAPVNEVDPTKVTSIVLRHVAPPLEFSTAYRVDCFNISFRNAAGAVVGKHDGLKYCHDVAGILAPKLSPA